MGIEVGTNSFVTLAEGDAYFLTRLYADRFWNEDLTNKGKVAALVTAYNLLVNCGKFSFPSEPGVDVKAAQCEMALFLLQHGEDMDARKGLQAQGVTGAGVVQETYDVNSLQELPIPASVMSMLKIYQTGDIGFGVTDIERTETDD